MTMIESLDIVSNAAVPQDYVPIPQAGKVQPGGAPASRSAAVPNSDPVIRPDKLQALACENETIRRARLGDAIAWESLVRQHVGWILRTCRRWAGSRSRAEDLTQDVFIRVFQTLHSYRGELAGFRIWLGRITRNLLIDDYRRNRRTRHTVSFDNSDEQMHSAILSVSSDGSDSEADIALRERKAALHRALRLLAPELREAVILRDVQGLTYLEIGRLLEIPQGTIKSRVHRGRMELIRLMRQRATVLPAFDSRASAVA